MLHVFGQATEPIADEWFRVLRRLEGEIGTLTRQVQRDALLSTDALAIAHLEDAQLAIEQVISRMDGVTNVEQLYALEEDGIRAVRIAQRHLRERRSEIEAMEEMEPAPSPVPDTSPEPRLPEPDPSPLPVTKNQRFPWGWMFAGAGLGIIGTSMVRRSR